MEPASHITPAASAPIDIGAALDRAKFGPMQRRVFLLCFLAMLIDGFDNHILAYAAPLILNGLGIEPASLGGLVSIALLGMMLGGLIGGSLADRIGRRSVILAGMAIFATSTIGKGLSPGYGAMMAMQAISGLGLGAVFINVLAMGAEYAPARHRRFLVTCISAAYPLGGISASFVAAAFAPSLGWRSLFLSGGLLSVMVLVACLLALPPSVRQLVLSGRDPQRVKRIMGRIGSYPPDAVWKTAEEPIDRAPVSQLFDRHRSMTTCLLALAVGTSLLSGYFVVSWSSMILFMAGVPTRLAMLASSMLPAGAVVGSLVWGRLCDRFWPPAVLGGAAVLSMACYASIGHLSGSYALLFVAMAVGGVGMGMQNAYNGFITSIYPTAVRGTALGVIIAFGRIVSALGPLLGGALVAAKWKATELYYVPAAFMGVTLLCMICVTMLPAARRFIADGIAAR